MSAPNPRLVAALQDRYRIERELGQGGMATVYLARDAKHDRLVALKILRPELAAVIGAERFLAEIKTTASLQHPHILPLHDSGEADGTVFYVMPYVEGESLRDRLNHDKQLPVEMAIRLTKEIASALDYAHRRGIVHRDIKPENILLHDDQALIADFGISLAVSRSEGGSRMTETGMSLGTPSYMAPEQAMGEREITQRADIYALGCVLYEMLTGDPPFTGSTAQAIVARMVTEQPRGISIQRHTVPEHVEAAVLMALEKLPADRFASASDFAAALENPALTQTRIGTTSRHVQHLAPSRRTAGLLGAMGLVTVGALAWALTRPAAEYPVSRYPLAFAEGAEPIADRMMAVSADGSRLIYVGPGEGSTTILWMKERSREQPVRLNGTTNVARFAISPNGLSIAFVTSTQELRKMSLTGGATVALATTASPSRGLAWLDDGTILYVQNGGLQLMRVKEVGGEATIVWSRDSTSFTTVFHPAALPGARGVLFMRCEGGTGCLAGTDLHALNLSSGETHLLAAGALSGEYARTGHLVYVRADGGLMAVPFNPRSLLARGEAVPMLDSISTSVNAPPAFSLSQEGTLYTRTGGISGATARYELAWVDRQGRETAVDSGFSFNLTVFGANAGWALSPDGQRLAIGLNTDAGDNIWVKRLPRGPLSRVTFDTVPSYRPRWRRDGRNVFYTSRRAGNSELFERSADGTGSERLAFSLSRRPGIFEAAWSPDEKWLALRGGGTIGVTGGRDIMLVRIGEDTVPRPLVASAQFDESGIALSPDGKWIAYESNETGRTEVYLRPFPDADGGKWQVSTDGGRAPLWNRNGRELFFVNGAREMISAPVGGGAQPEIGVPRTLFKLREELYLANQENYTPFDIAPDGQRFIMARLVRTATSKISPLVVTENWFEELRQKFGER